MLCKKTTAGKNHFAQNNFQTFGSFRSIKLSEYIKYQCFWTQCVTSLCRRICLIKDFINHWVALHNIFHFSSIRCWRCFSLSPSFAHICTVLQAWHNDKTNWQMNECMRLCWHFIDCTFNQSSKKKNVKIPERVLMEDIGQRWYIQRAVQVAEQHLFVRPILDICSSSQLPLGYSI